MSGLDEMGRDGTGRSEGVDRAIFATFTDDEHQKISMFGPYKQSKRGKTND